MCMKRQFTTIPRLVEKWTKARKDNPGADVELVVSDGRFSADIYRHWQLCDSVWLGRPMDSAKAYAALREATR